MSNLTDRQEAVLDYLKAHIATRGRPPTISEIADALGLASLFGVQKHLAALEAKGFVEIDAGKARGIRLVGAAKPAAQGMSLPLVGRVAAGQPILSDDLVEGTVVVDPQFFRPSPTYLLRVHGMSMRDAGILDRDLIGVRATPDAEHGQIVVARLGDEGITVKRLFRRGGQIRLLAANPDFPTIDPDPTEAFEVVGLYCGLMRAG
jgi:repressor LexA